jgi:hypothetical protein
MIIEVYDAILVLRRRRERRGVAGNKEESEMMGGRVRNVTRSWCSGEEERGEGLLGIKKKVK